MQAYISALLSRLLVTFLPTKPCFFMKILCYAFGKYMPPDKSVYWKINFLISPKIYAVGTQKNRLIETVLLSTQNTCLIWWARKKTQF